MQFGRESDEGVEVEVNELVEEVGLRQQPSDDSAKRVIPQRGESVFKRVCGLFLSLPGQVDRICLEPGGDEVAHEHEEVHQCQLVDCVSICDRQVG